jgi:hypothetical protein
MTDYLDDTEEYLKNAEKNIEGTAKIFGGLIFKCFYFIAGGMEYLIKPFMPKDEDEKPF